MFSVIHSEAEMNVVVTAWELIIENVYSLALRVLFFLFINVTWFFELYYGILPVIIDWGISLVYSEHYHFSYLLNHFVTFPRAIRLVEVLKDFAGHDWQLAGLACKTLWNYTEGPKNSFRHLIDPGTLNELYNLLIEFVGKRMQFSRCPPWLKIVHYFTSAHFGNHGNGKQLIILITIVFLGRMWRG